MSGLLEWLRHESYLASFLISILALAVGVWSACQAKRSAVAAEDQTSEAARSAREAARSADAAELALLDSARSRIESRVPRFVIGVEDVHWPPMLRTFRHGVHKADDTLPTAYPKTAPSDQQSRLTLPENRIDDLYFSVRGVVINDDPRSVQMRPNGPIFVRGESELAPGVIDIPRRFHPNDGDYLLRPGEVALFEWRASRTVTQWIQYYNDEEDRHVLPKAGFVVFPAGDRNAANYFGIELDCVPIVKGDEQGREWVISKEAFIEINVKAPEPWYPKSIEGLNHEIRRN